MSHLRKLAQGRDCQIRLPCCNHNPETTVLAHLSGGGMGLKKHDLHGAWSCSSCHDAVDGRDGGMWDNEWVRLCHLEAIVRTQEQILPTIEQNMERLGITWRDLLDGL